jgi:Rps23 Pro-64 3,4-dihydroxylase Tpa1-like proline 4-hydroxylase
MSLSLTGNFFPKGYLEDVAEKHAKEYQTAQPFSHVSLDNFLPEEWLNTVLEEFPSTTDPQWTQYKSETENGKFASTSYELIPPHTRYVLDQLNTPPFLQFLEKLTGIHGLIPDPYYMGGGMHQTKRGGWLSVHVDFNKYEEFNLYRRINVLLYLNKDWKEEYGGHLELWSDNMKICHDKIAPLFNRCVIFTTSENSHHGHPDPLMCPEGMTRKSLAWYYYTNTLGENISEEFHSTLFKGRPGERKLSKHGAKRFIKSLIPPLLLEISRKLRGIK